MLCTLRDFWRTFRLAGSSAYLAPDVSPRSPGHMTCVLRLAHQSFVTGARTGIRLSLLPCRVPLSPGGLAFRCHAQLPGRDHGSLPFQRYADAGLRRSIALPFRPDALACPPKPRRVRLKRSVLLLAEASFKPSLDERGDMFRRHPWEINNWNFKVLRPLVPVDLCPEDKLKVRFKRRSGNIHRREFSTSGDFACGHEWISQRLVAIAMRSGTISASNRQFCARWCLAPLGCDSFQLSRSRRDSSRSRSPLSLMKPSASFWS